MTALAGKNSFIDKNWRFVKQTLKGILQTNDLICPGDCDNKVLSTAQWAGGLLTRGQLFAHIPVVLNYTLNDFNSTIPRNSEIFAYFQLKGFP